MASISSLHHHVFQDVAQSDLAHRRPAPGLSRPSPVPLAWPTSASPAAPWGRRAGQRWRTASCGPPTRLLLGTAMAESAAAALAVATQAAPGRPYGSSVCRARV